LRLVRFLPTSGHSATPLCGVLTGEDIEVVTEGSYLSGSPQRTGGTFRLPDVTLLAPCAPTKVVAVGLNYRAHADEFGEAAPAKPKLFMKPSTAVIGPEQPIGYPPSAAQVDYEAELAVVIGKTLHGGGREAVAAAVAGYTCLNDVTARDLQKLDGQWTRAKSFDTFCPLGPWIETDLDPTDVPVSSRLNGEPRQSSTTALMIVPPLPLVEFIAGVMTLLPGDVVATGTPEGVGPMQPGDVVEVEVGGVGVLRNTVSGE